MDYPIALTMKLSDLDTRLFLNNSNDKYGASITDYLRKLYDCPITSLDYEIQDDTVIIYNIIYESEEFDDDLDAIMDEYESSVLSNRKWHDIGCNPTDLPKDKSEVLICINPDNYYDSKYEIAVFTNGKWCKSSNMALIKNKVLGWYQFEEFVKTQSKKNSDFEMYRELNEEQHIQ